MAAQIRRELQTQVDMIHAKYGEFKVLVDDEIVVEGGALGFLGVLPSSGEVIEAVRKKLSAGS